MNIILDKYMTNPMTIYIKCYRNFKDINYYPTYSTKKEYITTTHTIMEMQTFWVNIVCIIMTKVWYSMCRNFIGKKKIMRSRLSKVYLWVCMWSIFGH